MSKAGELVEYLARQCDFSNVRVYGWTDSTVALAWVSQHPSRWKPWVANRVSEIQTRVPTIQWGHVRTQCNPADCASRGLNPSEIVDHPLWWRGPPWLSLSKTQWPVNSTTSGSLDHPTVRTEARVKSVCLAVNRPIEWELPMEFSSWSRLLRVTAWIRRFTSNARVRTRDTQNRSGPLTGIEIKSAQHFWFAHVQGAVFAREVEALRSQRPIPHDSELRALNPFIDGEGLLRLGGRLTHSPLNYSESYPILLPRHRISDLLVRHAHLKALHGGTQLTLRMLRQQVWITRARALVKSAVRSCLPCVRQRAAVTTQLMGDLPASRVSPSAPFAKTGVDYAGPMSVTPYVGRGQRARNFYVAVFVCLATREIHLEPVDDYATSGFLAALRRFISRRGLPTELYSDNGKNFEGADKELRRVFEAVARDPDLHASLANDQITWHFIPPAAPHFGGLWEAGVKSLKHHLRRVVGQHTLSQMEFATLLTQIEACLNSRPIGSLRDDPDDLSAITPGHFLIGRPLTSLPEVSLSEVPENRLSRWQKVQATREQIWKCWSHDYLHSLHQRNKWQQASPEVRLHELVLLRDPLSPPARWKLARVVKVHPGPDGHVRVVTLRTENSTYERPIAKVCRLPAPDATRTTDVNLSV